MFKIKDKAEDGQDDVRCKYFKAKDNLHPASQSTSSSASVNQSKITDNSQPTTSSQPSNAQNSQTSVAKTSVPSGSLNDPKARKQYFGSTLLVNSNQSGNKLLKHLRVPYQLTDSISPAHYQMFESCCALFLSLKYHVIYPDYIYDKLNELKNTYQLKVLLVLIDHIEYQSALKELTKLSIRVNCTLILAWSYEEAANHIENYRNFADKSADIITGKQNAASEGEGAAYQCLVDGLTSIRSINKTDAVSLISMFDTFENIVKSDDDQLIVCPGMASLKAQRLRQFFHKPFIRSND